MQHWTGTDLISRFGLDEDEDKEIIELLRKRYTESSTTFINNINKKINDLDFITNKDEYLLTTIEKGG